MRAGVFAVHRAFRRHPGTLPSIGEFGGGMQLILYVGSFAVVLEDRQSWRPCMETLDRITQHPEIMGGKACIRGIRVTVGMLVGQIGAGRSVDELLAEYPYLEREDILQALRYAAWRAEEREVVLANA